jgi:tetratricopeptide (TPR) repeat protein
MSEPSLLILGQPLWRGAAGRTPLRQREAALLAYLADHSPRQLRRESLASMFWPAASTVRGLRSLSQLYYQTKNQAPEVVWISDTKLIGIEPILTDLESLSYYARNGSFETAVNLIRGQVLLEPISWSNEMELWRQSKQNELVDSVNVIAQHIIDSAGDLVAGSLFEKAIDHILQTGTSSPELATARILLHLASGQDEAARILHTKSTADFHSVPSFELLAAHTRAQVQSAGDTEELPKAKFVGRDEEIAVLRHKLNCAAQGSGSVVLLLGEAGIGKTRLANHFLRRAALSGARIWTVQAHLATRRIPYFTTISLLSSNWRGWNSKGETKAHWWNHLTEDINPASLVDEASKFVLLQAVANTIEREAAESTLVVLIDDAQWIDDFTAQLLMYLSVRAPKVRLLLLLTIRTGEPDATPDWLPNDLPNSSVIQVSQLTVEDAAGLVRSFEKAHALDLSSKIRSRILWDTAGRPLLILETLAAYAGAAEHEVGEFGSIVTGSSEAVLLRRFKDLDHQCVWIYGVIATGGTPMRVADLAEISEVHASDLAQTLSTLFARGILESKEDKVAYPHDLLREVAYRSLTIPARILIHQKFADYYIAQNRDEGAIAQHLAAADRGELASVYAMRAAKQAGEAGRHADQEFYYRLTIRFGAEPCRSEAAVALCRHLLLSGRVSEVGGLIESVDDSSCRDEAQFVKLIASLMEDLRTGEIPPDQLLSKTLSLSGLTRSGDYSVVTPILSQIMNVGLDASDLNAVNRMVSDFTRYAEQSGEEELATYSRYMALLWQAVTVGYESSLRELQTANDRLEGRASLAGFGHFVRGTILMLAGDLTASRDELEDALRIAEECMDQSREAAAYANLGVVMTELGDFAGAQRCLEANLASPSFTLRVRALGNLATLSYEKGDYDHAIATARAVLVANEHYDAKKYFNTSHAIIGLSLMGKGEWGSSTPIVHRIWSAEHAVTEIEGDIPYVISFVTLWLANNGNVEGALKLIDLHMQQLSARDVVGVLRLRATRAEIMHMANLETAYGAAKTVYEQCIRAGALAIGARARSTMLQARA